MLEGKSVGEAWQKKLAQGGYEHSITSSKECVRLKKLPRIWRRVLRETGININNLKSIFEVGCGGGKHLMPFVMRGWRATGIDVSDDVLNRAREFFASAKKQCGIENIIDFVRPLKRDEIVKPLISQIVRSATSIGANYMEANQASSKRDFRNKIQISRKESNETNLLYNAKSYGRKHIH